MTLRETPPSTGLTSSSQTTLQAGTNSFQFYRWGCIVPRISSFQTQDFRHTVMEAAPSACPMRLLIVPTSQGSTEMSKATVISPFSSQCWKTPVSTPPLAYCLKPGDPGFPVTIRCSKLTSPDNYLGTEFAGFLQETPQDQ